LTIYNFWGIIKKINLEGVFMKLKHVLWIVTAITAIAAIAAGVAVFVNRFLAEEDEENYLECEVEPDVE
jgi:hypothetical protein